MDNSRHPGSSGPISQSSSENMSPSSSSSIDQAQGISTLGLYIPRPAYQRPASYGQPSPSNCAHCGNLTPRYGTTTLYGTPLKQTPATSTEQLSRFSDRYSVVRSAYASRFSGFACVLDVRFTDMQKTTSSIRGKAEKNPEISMEPVCLVERVHGTDDIDHIPLWKRRINKCTPIFSLIAVSSYWVYFAFRIKYTLAAQHVVGKVFGMAWAFIAIEMGVACEY